jgi:predicted DNA-binding transcriptional regulator YafY
MKRKREVIKQRIPVRQTPRRDRGETVRIIFDADVVPLVLEREWFKPQQITSFPDGRIELRFTTASLVGLDRWIFGWGPSAQVIEPDYLRRQIVEMAQEIVARG